MVKKTALKTAGISMAGFQPRAKVLDGQTPDAPGEAAPAPPPRDATRPFTGVGSVMAAITREAEVSQALAGAQARLAEATTRLAAFEGAQVVRALDPRSVRRSPWANRLEAEFGTPEFAALQQEIANAGGNVQPIQVRAIAGAPAVFDGQTPTHEIVYGHRRHQACLVLGLPVNAVIVDDMDDKALFEAMDRENRGRKNLSPWEQGRMYDAALRQGLYTSLRRLADALGVNLSDASRAVQLANLPPEVVAAFASPLDLQVRWAKPLADAWQRDPEGVLARARACAARTGPRPAAEVYSALIGAPGAAAPSATWIAAGRRRLAVLQVDAKGRAQIAFEPGVLPPGRHAALVQLLKAFLTGPAEG